MHIASLCGVKTKPLLFPPLPAAIGEVLSPTTASTTTSFALQVLKTQCPWKEKQRQRHEEDPRERNAQLKKTQRERVRERNAQSLINPKTTIRVLPERVKVDW
jgi:hypothetical protein